MVVIPPVISNNAREPVKVLLYHHLPFALAHGGQQIQILRTAEALRQAGVQADLLDWRDEQHSADILHFFGRVPRQLLDLAQLKGWKVVVADLLGGQGARGKGRLAFEGFLREAMEVIVPAAQRQNLPWTTYRDAHACVALTPWEKDLFHHQFKVPTQKIHVVPNGVDDVFFQGTRGPRAEWLLCVATITPIKRVLETAQMAVRAQVPIRFIGRPYAESDSYAEDFATYVAGNRKWLTASGPVEDREALAKLYQQAHGFVLLSQYESLSLSALEAAAASCPVLLSDLPWARSTFGNQATYCSLADPPQTAASCLRSFYEACPTLPIPEPPPRWSDVASRLRQLYTTLVN